MKKLKNYIGRGWHPDEKKPDELELLAIKLLKEAFNKLNYQVGIRGPRW